MSDNEFYVKDTTQVPKTYIRAGLTTILGAVIINYIGTVEFGTMIALGVVFFILAAMELLGK